MRYDLLLPRGKPWTSFDNIDTAMPSPTYVSLLFTAVIFCTYFWLFDKVHAGVTAPCTYIRRFVTDWPGRPMYIIHWQRTYLPEYWQIMLISHSLEMYMLFLVRNCQCLTDDGIGRQPLHINTVTHRKLTKFTGIMFWFLCWQKIVEHTVFCLLRKRICLLLNLIMF